MKKDDNLYVSHMLDMARKSVEKTEAKNYSDYIKDETLRMALAHLVQIIGEAESRVSTEFQINTPQIPWKQIIGIRHKRVHDYMHIDYDIIWDVVTYDLPPVIEELKKIAA